MKKRLLPALLALTLLLSLMPTAFAATSVTLTQQTMGEFADTNKKFVYYIPSYNDSVSVTIENGKVEKFKGTAHKCNCGFTVFSFQENPDTIFDKHAVKCPNNYLVYQNINIYKVMLKNGETININEKGGRIIVYAIQEDDYPISYSSNEKDYTNFVNDGTIYRSQTTLANLIFDTTQNGTLTVRRTSVPVAYPSTQTVDLNGKEVEFQMYALKDENGNDTNYIKIRDLALALNGTGSQFNIGWANGAANIETGKAYVPNGSENTTPFSGERPYTRNTSPTNLNGAGIDLAGIVLTDDSGGGYTYCQVKDLAAKLSFIARWDGARGIICIETNKPYTGELSPETGVCTHSWATRHVAEVGHYEESTGTHSVKVMACYTCGIHWRTDDPDFDKKYDEHRYSEDTWYHGNTIYYIEVPDDPEYVVDTPAYDETYCTICGTVK